MPKLGPGWGYRYEKFQLSAQDWAVVGVAALARRDNGHVAEARIGLTNMGTVPVRARAAEAAAAGAEASRQALAAAGARADEGTEPPRRPAGGARLPPSPGPGADGPGAGRRGPGGLNTGQITALRFCRNGPDRAHSLARSGQRGTLPERDGTRHNSVGSD